VSCVVVIGHDVFSHDAHNIFVNDTITSIKPFSFSPVKWFFSGFASTNSTPNFFAKVFCCSKATVLSVGDHII
jgi:hypothetical protein